MSILSKRIRAVLETEGFAAARALLAPAKPRKPVLGKNVRRAKREWLRAYGSLPRVEFVKALPCAIGGRYATGCHGHVVNAHVGNEGAGIGRKANADQIAPLCDRHHWQLDDDLGPGIFEQRYGVQLSVLAAACEAAWQEHCA